MDPGMRPYLIDYDNGNARLGFGWVGSWRGDYTQMTIGTVSLDEAWTAREIINQIEKACSSGMEGYKGGNYSMSGAYSLYADDYGMSGEVFIQSVSEDGDVELGEECQY